MYGCVFIVLLYYRSHKSKLCRTVFIQRVGKARNKVVTGKQNGYLISLLRKDNSPHNRNRAKNPKPTSKHR